MCGIFGMLAFGGATAYPREFLARMGNRLRHRGPDDDGYLVDGPMAMGMRRLSIIDIRGGQQPISNEAGDVHVIFNGEIYNYMEIRSELAAEGRKLRTHSDTEVLVHLYEKMGVNMLDRLRGMFAFAIWDSLNRTLFIARDRVGKKPLHYAVTPKGVTFASEIKSILLDNSVSREIDPQAADQYFTMHFVPAPRTIFRAIRKLPPAHYMIATPDGVRRITRYWSLPRGQKLSLSESEAVEAVRDMVTESTKIRLVSDVPIGLLLSGGLDSAVVAAAMTSAGRRIKTFSVGFLDEPETDDLKFSRLVANRLGTEHHPLRLTPKIADVAVKLAGHFDEPFGDSSAVPTYLIAREARQHVTVALNGDGGDEAFAGYPRYDGRFWFARLWPFLPDAARASIKSALFSPLRELHISESYALKKMRKWLLPAHRVVFQPDGMSVEEKGRLYKPDFAASLEPGRWDDLLKVLDEASLNTTNPGESVLNSDIQIYLPGDLLVKMDMASMAASLEARSPLLDHKLLEFTAKLPWTYKIRGRGGKWILRRAFERQIPPEILSRRKMGFSLPLRDWIRGDIRSLVEDVIFGPADGLSGLFDRKALRKEAETILAAKSGGEKKLWSWLMFELWHRSLSQPPPE